MILCIDCNRNGKTMLAPKVSMVSNSTLSSHGMLLLLLFGLLFGLLCCCHQDHHHLHIISEMLLMIICVINGNNQSINDGDDLVTRVWYGTCSQSLTHRYLSLSLSVYVSLSRTQTLFMYFGEALCIFGWLISIYMVCPLLSLSRSLT
jgi:hypothetical protein